MPDPDFEKFIKIFAALGPVVGVVGVTIGWMLNEFGSTRRLRREERSAKGRVLAELLELHHTLPLIPRVLAEVRNVLPVAATDLLELRQVLAGVMPDSAEAGRRFNTAVDLVSSFNPLLAFRLRAKDRLPATLDMMAHLMSSDEDAAQILPELEKLLTDAALESLRELCVELAADIGGHALRERVRTIVEADKEPVLPAEIKDMITKMVLQQQQRQLAQKDGEIWRLRNQVSALSSLPHSVDQLPDDESTTSAEHRIEGKGSPQHDEP